MSKQIDAVSLYFKGLLIDTWRWFAMLDHQEWIVVLALVSCCGFLCMRGFGSRSNY